jgi:hypothetical protein
MRSCLVITSLFTLVACAEPQRSPDPPEVAKVDVERLISGSDDYQLYKGTFEEATTRLISEGTCSESDFLELGGWTKSVNAGRDVPIYFTYCGGMTTANRVYLDARDGRTYR